MSDARPVRVSVPPEAAEFGELVRRTHKSNPKPKDVEALRQHLQQHPELWRVAGNVAEFAYDRLVDAAAGDKAALRESLAVLQLFACPTVLVQLPVDLERELERLVALS